MAWSMEAVMCGDNFLGYLYRSVGGSFSASHCAAVQQQHNSKQINNPGKAYVSPYSIEDLTGQGKMIDKKTHFVFPKSYQQQTTHMKGQCVSLVRGAVPALDVQTSNWRKGDALDEKNIGKITPGTAIGYGWIGDKYASKKTGNHVALFQSYSALTGKITVVDQWHRSASDNKPEKFQQPTSHEMPLKGHDWAVVTLRSETTTAKHHIGSANVQQKKR